MQAALQLVYVGLAVYGWIAWQREPAADFTPVPPWPLATHLIALAAIAAATAATVPLVGRYAGDSAPVADALGTWASLLATWLLARRHREAWLWWIAIDLGLAGLFLRQELPGTAALYLGFAVLAGVGWRSWRPKGVTSS
jgi:nicotinamide mononucleotide transporter